MSQTFLITHQPTPRIEGVAASARSDLLEHPPFPKDAGFLADVVLSTPVRGLSQFLVMIVVSWKAAAHG